MKPNDEYIARQLAATVLYGDGSERGRADDAGVGVVEVEMRGMVRSIRRQLLVDHVQLAGRIADEIERQTKGVDVDKFIASAVAKEIERVKAIIPALVAKHVESTIDQEISHACKTAAAVAITKVTRGVKERLYYQAFPRRKKGPRP